jgi:hypothetical protein
VVTSEQVSPTSTTTSETRSKHTHQQYDEDEFIGFEQDSNELKHDNADAIPATTTTTSTQQHTEERFVPPPRTNYYLEYLYIGVIVMYAINFWIGKRKNEQIAKEW